MVKTTGGGQFSVSRNFDKFLLAHSTTLASVLHHVPTSRHSSRSTLLVIIVYVAQGHRRSIDEGEACDYVIAGGGAAGLVLVTRLPSANLHLGTCRACS
jgi:hypothetical protein